MSRREPWAVRLYRRAAWTVGDLSTDAADAFALLYADERRRGRAAALRLWLRAMVDLARAGVIARPRPLAGFGHDLRRAWRMLRTRPGLSLIVSDTNLGARRLYESRGYREVAKRKMVKEGWKHPGVDWVLMRKDLEGRRASAGR